MNPSEIWKFINDNSGVLGVIIPVVGSVFTLIGFFINRMIVKRHSKKSSDSKTINKQQLTIEKLQNKINSLNSELDKYRLVQKATDGDFLIQIETNTPICPICWSNNKKYIPVYIDGTGYFTCSICNHHGKYNYRIIDDYIASSIDDYNRDLKNHFDSTDPFDL